MGGPADVRSAALGRAAAVQRPPESRPAHAGLRRSGFRVESVLRDRAARGPAVVPFEEGVPGPAGVVPVGGGDATTLRPTTTSINGGTSTGTAVR